jgi:hypothetical protein
VGAAEGSPGLALAAAVAGTAPLGGDSVFEQAAAASASGNHVLTKPADMPPAHAMPAATTARKRASLRLGWLGLSSERLSATQSPRSAVPLAAAGIICLGFAPVLGGPERPPHWAMTAGMVGFGALLWARHGLRGGQGPLLAISKPAASAAGRAVLGAAAAIAVSIAFIVGFRLQSGGAISTLSLALPALGLAWVALLGVQALRHPATSVEEPAAERPSRRPPEWEALPNRKSNHPGPPDGHASV